MNNTTSTTASENTTNVISQEVENSTSGEIRNIVDVPDDPVAVGKKP